MLHAARPLAGSADAGLRRRAVSDDETIDPWVGPGVWNWLYCMLRRSVSVGKINITSEWGRRIPRCVGARR